MMRNLLLLFTVPASLAGYYLWRLRPSEVEWNSLTGIALATLTIIFWSAVLQIAWRDKEDRPNSPSDLPESPAGFEKRRMALVWLFAVLAIPATLLTVNWARSDSRDELDQFCQATGLPAPIPSAPNTAATTFTSPAMLSTGPGFAPPFQYADTQFVSINGMPLGDDSFAPTPLVAKPQEIVFRFSFTPRPRPAVPMLPIPAKTYPGDASQLHPLARKRRAELTQYGSGPNRLYNEFDNTPAWQVDVPEMPEALGQAIQRGNAARVEELIDAGADPNAMNPFTGRSPLEEAELVGQEKLIDMLKAAGAKPTPDA